MGELTFRQKIIEAIAKRLQDYEWGDLEPSIHIGRTVFDPDVDALPVVAVVAGVETSSRTRYGTDQRTMPVDITALVSLEDGKEAYEIGEPFFGELYRAIFSGGAIEILPEEEGEGEGEPEPIPDYITIEYTGGGIAEYPSELGPAVLTIVISASVVFETSTGDPCK